MFTVEELTVMQMYNPEDRLNLIDDLIVASVYVDDPVMANLIDAIVDKLIDINDEQFEKIDFSEALDVAN